MLKKSNLKKLQELFVHTPYLKVCDKLILDCTCTPCSNIRKELINVMGYNIFREMSRLNIIVRKGK